MIAKGLELREYNKGKKGAKGKKNKDQ